MKTIHPVLKILLKSYSNVMDFDGIRRSPGVSENRSFVGDRSGWGQMKRNPGKSR